MEKNEKKSERTIIKCKDCGFKYYDGDIHKCPGVSAKEKPTPTPEGVGVPTASVGKEKKETPGTHKQTLKHTRGWGWGGKRENR